MLSGKLKDKRVVLTETGYSDGIIYDLSQVDSSINADEGASSSDPEDHRWLAGQVGGSGGEEWILSADYGGGTCHTRCGDGFDFLFMLYVMLL